MPEPQALRVHNPGLLVGGGVLAAVGALFLTFTVHWFPLSLLALGLGGIGLGFVESRPAEPPVPAPASLAEALGELERLAEAGVLTEEEAMRKRRQLLDAWGTPTA